MKKIDGAKKTIRNVIVFGVILCIVIMILSFITGEALDLIDLDGIEDKSIALRIGIATGTSTILYFIAMVITKKIFSIKIKISYEEAKKMLLIILIILLIINIIKFILLYKNSIDTKDGIDSMINLIEYARTTDEYKSISTEEKNSMEELYKQYTEGRDEMIELEDQKMKISTINSTIESFLCIIWFYGFGLFLYRKDKKTNVEQQIHIETDPEKNK